MSDFCPLCKYEIETAVIAYKDTPFVNGKKYNYICFPCSEVPKSYYYKGDELIILKELDSKKLNTIKEMQEEGFTEEEAKASVKAVKAAIKKAKK